MVLWKYNEFSEKLIKILTPIETLSKFCELWKRSHSRLLKEFLKMGKHACEKNCNGSKNRRTHNITKDARQWATPSVKKNTQLNSRYQYYGKWV